MTKTASWVLKSEVRCVRFQSVSLPIHVAITRRVRPGCESEFQEMFRERFPASPHPRVRWHPRTFLPEERSGAPRPASACNARR
jgi:hypothetical protein